MQIKLDENLPATLVTLLAALGHDVDTVPHEELQGRPDEEVWRSACAAGRLLITQDLDFSDARRFAPGTHPGILLLRLRDPARRRLMDRIEALFAGEDVEAWSTCIVVATDHKVRIRRPSGHTHR